MLTATSLIGFGSGSVAANVSSLAFGSSATAATPGSSTTYTLDIGTASADRYVLIGTGVHVNGTGAASVKIHVPDVSTDSSGTACSVVLEGTSNSEVNSSFWLSDSLITSGTSAEVVIVYDSGGAFRAGAASWALYNINTTVSDTDTSTANPFSGTVTIPADGIAFAYVINSASANSYDWTGGAAVTERFDDNPEAACQVSGADHATAGSIEFNAQGSPAPGASRVMAVVAFGPPS